MATEEALKCITLPAAADLSAKQYRAMTVDSNGRAAVSTRGQGSAGILQNNPGALDRAATIAIAGVSKVVLGGTVTKGQKLVSDANGALVNASSSDNNFLGIAIGSGGSGEIIAALIQPTGLS